MKKFTILSILLMLFLAGVKSQTSFIDDFNSGTKDSGWLGNGSYGLSQSGGVLTVSANTHLANTIFTLDLKGNHDFSSKPYVNLKMKTNTPCIVQIAMVDASGAKATQVVRLPVVSPNLVNYCFDYTSATINKAQIKALEFSFNPTAISFSGKITFEDLTIGTAAAQFASISPVADVVVYKGKTAQKIILTDIKNADTITIGGATHLSNVKVSAIKAGVCTITFDCSSVGTDNIILTAVGSGAFANNTSTFALTVEDNNAPTINKPADIDVPVGKATLVKLTGISDGNSSVEQSVTITAVSSVTASIPDPTITPAYVQGSPYAILSINPTAAGTSVITVTVKDDGGSTDTKTTTFNVTSHNNFNTKPTINSVVNQSMYLSAGTMTVNLSGISTGDPAGQTLTITAVGKHADVISGASVNYTQGNNTAVLTITAAGLGADTITVSVTDNGGAGANGPQTATISFIVDVLKPAPKGYVVPMVNFAADTAAKLWTIEDNNVQQFCSYVDTLGSRCLRIQLKSKRTYGGLWYNLPEEFNLSENPVISYEILAKGFSPLRTHVYFWDVDTQRNSQGATLEGDTITTNIDQFHTNFSDFRKPGYLIGGSGLPIKSNRIARLLFNYHKEFKWPFSDINGTVYIRNIRLGDSCKNIPPVVPVCKIDNIPTQLIWAGAGQKTLTLTGIHNGAGSTTGVTFTVLSGKTPYIPHPSIGTLGSDGKAVLTYDVLTSNVDSAKIVIIVKAPGSIEKNINFYIKSVSPNPVNAVTVNVDASIKGQTIAGFGSMAPKENQLDMFAKNQGCTMMRITVDGDFEKSNDNLDHNVLNRSAYNKSELNLDYLRAARDAGVTDFFVTLWSPPAWMKKSLSQVGYGTPSGPTSSNTVDTMYYNEYVEYMVAIVRIIKEETGIELVGFCPQNEPAFEEPYGSALLYPTPMAKVCGMLGKRLSEEGFKTKPITAEQVFGQGSNTVVQFATAIKNDALASVYSKVVGMHYPDDNITAWTQQWNACKNVTGNPQDYWATECRTEGNNWVAVVNQLKYMTVGMNYGCSSWVLWGYNNGSTGNEDDPTVVGGNMMGPNGTTKHFWAFKNYAKFVKKGAVQLKSTSSNGNVVVAAFENTADTTMTIVLVNTDHKLPYAVRFTGSAPSIGWEAYRTSFFEKCEKVNAFKDGLLSLPPRSVTTITIKTDINHAPTIDPIADMTLSEGFGSAVNLTGLGCGDPKPQTLTITATSSDTTVIKHPTVNYNPLTGKGSLLIAAPLKIGSSSVITIIVKDDGGRENGGIDADTIQFVVNAAAYMKDVSDKVSVYPNPATETVNIVVPAELSSAKLIITNMAGQVIADKKLAGETQVQLGVSDFVSGTYIIRIEATEVKAKLQFLKK